MNPLFYISGVEHEANTVRNDKKKINILNLFTLFAIIALLAGFFVFYWFGKTYISTGAGIIMGLLYATTVISMDRLLFKEGGWILAIGRILAIIILSFVTGSIAGVTSGKTVIENRIEKNTGYQNANYQKEMQEIDNKYKNQIEQINNKMLAEIKEAPKNTAEIKSVFMEMKKDNEKERQRAKDNTRISHKIEHPDYSLGNVIITYYNKLEVGEKFNGFYWLFFILEFMPLLWRGIYEVSDMDM